MQEAQAALETARAETAAQAGAHKAELEALQARLEAKEGELGIALRSQAMTQSDLMHLRQRFETLQTEKNKVDALLTQVTSRLSIASKYLHLLDASARQEQFPSRSDTGPDRPTLLETPLDPRPKKRGKKRGKKP
ncbi:hypothetical protein [Ruegeria marina]|uniref:Uncharacterized protein n=1 Tax=Ruegeria marina TaxID=639004 RepID=A0A1G7E9R2_9RHOB|nr:hypothetical protein [Ruegeria marina]SDE60441.1 hypothetical protein SAMN04488239_12445 [Ruegeria marina]